VTGLVAGPITGATKLAAVIGYPVRHSLSPALHNAAFQAAGLDWRFLAFEVEPGGAGAAVDAMKALGICGLAVTAPHKAAVAGAVDRLDEAAAAMASVNTVSLLDDGVTIGASTDGAGFVASLVEAGCSPTDARFVVLGAGGAARAIVDALGRAGASDIAIVNRTASAAHDAAKLADVARIGSIDDVAAANVLVNATSIGLGGIDLDGDACPVDTRILRSDLDVVDIVYHPLETNLLRAARSIGARTIDGLGMLVHQAVLQQEIWTGLRPDAGALRAVAEAELASRPG
jgi:shikimate dehydrogenase